MTLEYAGGQMSGICTHWTELCHVHHNVICDRGTAIADRHQGCDGIGRAARGIVHHNLLLRVRQRGLGGKEVCHNEIYGDSFAANSFAVSVVPDGKYYANRIFGTGYHFVAMDWAGGVTVNNNFIHVQGGSPTARSDEFGVQASGNGFRLTQYAGSQVDYDNALYHDNVVVVRGRGGCQMRGVQFFSDPHVKNLVFRHNLVKALAEDDRTRKISCVVAQGNPGGTDRPPPVLYEDNTFIANVANVSFGDDYGAGSNHWFFRCKFVRSGGDPRYKTIVIDTHATCKNHLFRDCIFADGASSASAASADKDADADYAVQWTLTLESAPNADVIVRERNGREAFRGKTDAAGALKLPLTECIRSPAGADYRTPHEIRVISGEKNAEKQVKMDKAQTLRVQLD
jgi:hypothetical protein